MNKLNQCRYLVCSLFGEWTKYSEKISASSLCKDTFKEVPENKINNCLTRELNKY